MPQCGAVESEETILGSDPQVTILFLEYAVDRGCQTLVMGNLGIDILLSCR